MTQNSTRRDFLKTSAASASAVWWLTGTQNHAVAKSKLEQINFACIGVGGKGRVDTTNAGKVGNVVALCDVDAKSLDGMAKNYSSAEKFEDYRKMFDAFGDKFDAVTVVTPDHSHAAAAVMAMRHKKHVYCQKPLTWSVQEARIMRKLAAEFGVQTQMGNQGTSNDGLREAAEVIRSGAIGTVKDVHVWTNRPIWPQGTGRPEKAEEIPAHVNWDLFLGPAPERPYSSKYHPFAWRGWLDFGTGALGDMACHTANMAVMALSLFDPVRVSAQSSGIVENESFPKWSQIEFDFPAIAERPAVKMYWYDGGKLPSPELLYGNKPSDSGSLIVGDKGSLYSPNDYGAQYMLLPKEKFADYKKPEQSIPRNTIPGNNDEKQMGEFAAAINGGPAAMSNFDYAGRLTETILLGNVALRAAQPIEWDAENAKVTNMPEANAFLGREYRSGWTL
ncbi:MAG TPA: Gfo/Idh/MocA family oxidoreductase [Planctomycetaceae bacterium]|nr:Gfo/Idh/MocA family oxidoreductase [Planctomycetaceae bacterium]